LIYVGVGWRLAGPPRNEQFGIVFTLATYFFDLHSDSLSSWDDDGRECASPEEIVQHAAEMLTEALDGTRDDHAVVSVRDADGTLILTVTLNQRTGLRSEWAVPPRPGTDLDSAPFDS
jgi:hypothetical protein